MAKTLDQIKQQIARFKEQKPYYREILDLYALILEEQARIRPQLRSWCGPDWTKAYRCWAKRDSSSTLRRHKGSFTP
jgi:hypothetical protein